MTTVFESPDFTSESILGNGDNAIVATELPPVVPEETLPEKVESLRGKFKGTNVQCDICGDEMNSRGLGPHKRLKHGVGVKNPETPKIGTSTSKERKPRIPKTTIVPRRVKADDILTLLVGGAGSLVAMTVSAPTGMALKLEAGLLGPELDNLVAGTIVDKAVVQPLVKTKGKFEKIAPLAMFPALVFALDKNPQMLPQLYPLLRMTMMEMLPALVEAKKRQAAEAEKLRDAAMSLAALDPEFAEMFGTDGGDPIDALIQSMFAMKVQPEPEAPAEPGSAWNGD